MKRDQLLQKYLKGDTTSAERHEFLRLVQSDSSLRDDLKALKRLDDISLWRNVETKQHGVVRSKQKKSGLFSVLWKIAAVVVLAFAGYLSINNETLKGEEEFYAIYVPVGDTRQITLSDSTIVWLNSNTTIWISREFEKGKRNVKLSGEGFFEVTKDEKHPFTVAFGKHKVRVLGTQFNVNTNSQNSCPKVALLEGSVEVLGQNDASLVQLKPGEELWVLPDCLKVKPIKSSNRFAWRKGLLVFDNNTFQEILQVLERTYDVDFKVQRDEMLEYRCSAKFRINDGVEHILKVLKLKTPFAFKLNDNQIIIK
ncbi:FecR family protein [Prolixibacteraceae bacterium JC049]|nr:FecR family protein [Prolixibacteraceae bacterium JC049]